MSRYFPAPAECGQHTLFGCVDARTYAGDHLQLSLVDIPPGGVVEWHSHPHEQIGMVIDGTATFYIGDEAKDLGPGDFYLMPGGVPHRVVAHDKPVRALDVFHPPRHEYR
ncbi:MAG: cupin domain-containing protein [Gemmataceae bacterium]